MAFDTSDYIVVSVLKIARAQQAGSPLSAVSILKLLLGATNFCKLRRYQPIVSDINLLEDQIAPFSDHDLRRRTAEFRQRLNNAGTLSIQRPVIVDYMPDQVQGLGMVDPRPFCRSRCVTPTTSRRGRSSSSAQA